MRFLDVFLLHCLLRDSPPDTPQEIAAIPRNKQRVAARGREPGLMLESAIARGARSPNGAARCSTECAPIAAALDAANGVTMHREALAARGRRRWPIRRHALGSRAAGDGARPRQRLCPLRPCAVAQAPGHAFSKLPLSAESASRFARLAEESLAKQREIEASDSMLFEMYRQQYLSPLRLNV